MRISIYNDGDNPIRVNVDHDESNDLILESGDERGIQGTSGQAARTSRRRDLRAKRTGEKNPLGSGSVGIESFGMLSVVRKRRGLQTLTLLVQKLTIQIFLDSGAGILDAAPKSYGYRPIRIFFLETHDR